MPGVTVNDMAKLAHGRSARRPGRRRGRLISRSGWAFVVAMLFSGLLWAGIIAAVAAAAHHLIAQG